MNKRHVDAFALVSKLSVQLLNGSGQIEDAIQLHDNLLAAFQDVDTTRKDEICLQLFGTIFNKESRSKFTEAQHEAASDLCDVIFHDISVINYNDINDFTVLLENCNATNNDAVLAAHQKAMNINSSTAVSYLVKREMLEFYMQTNAWKLYQPQVTELADAILEIGTDIKQSVDNIPTDDIF